MVKILPAASELRTQLAPGNVRTDIFKKHATFGF